MAFPLAQPCACPTSFAPTNLVRKIDLLCQKQRMPLLPERRSFGFSSRLGVAEDHPKHTRFFSSGQSFSTFFLAAQHQGPIPGANFFIAHPLSKEKIMIVRPNFFPFCLARGENTHTRGPSLPWPGRLMDNSLPPVERMALFTSGLQPAESYSTRFSTGKRSGAFVGLRIARGLLPSLASE